MKFIGLILLSMALLACSESDEQETSLSTTRSFRMGFTPWLYAATSQAESDVYDFINNNGDIVAHHFQQGIPFNDAMTFPNFSSYQSNIQSEVNNRINLTTSGKTIYLAIDSLNTARDDLTDFWDTSANTTRPSPWDTRSFNDSNVITAYTNFALELIARFNPTYFNYAPEVSELMLNDATKFNEFKTFAQTVYTTIKGLYPNLKLMVSISLKTPGSTDMSTVTSGFADISAYVDVAGISVYPYAFFGHSDAGDPANLPDGWLSQISTIAPNKAYAVVETGWIAEDLSIPAYSLSVTSDEAKQQEFLEALFSEANNLDMEAIIWFSSHDYDTLWTDTLGSDNLSKIWKDTGLVDQSLSERASLTTWETWLGYTLE